MNGIYRVVHEGLFMQEKLEYEQNLNIEEDQEFDFGDDLYAADICLSEMSEIIGKDDCDPESSLMKKTVYKILCSYNTDLEDEEFKILFEEVVGNIIKQQSVRQKIYGVSFYSSYQKETWIVPYKKYRDTEEIINDGYYTREEKNRITEENWRLVLKCVGIYAPKSIQRCPYTYEDIYDACVEGFSRALNSYNSKIKGKFSVYAYHAMENAVYDVIRRSKIRDLATESLNAAVFDDDPDSSYINEIEDENSQKEFENTEKKDAMCVLINTLMQDCEDDEKYLLYHYYGLFGYEECNKTQLAQMFHMSSPAIKKKLDATMNKLKIKLREINVNGSELNDIFC